MHFGQAGRQRVLMEHSGKQRHAGLSFSRVRVIRRGGQIHADELLTGAI
jgi:hypothetical protein